MKIQGNSLIGVRHIFDKSTEIKVLREPWLKENKDMFFIGSFIILFLFIVISSFVGVILMNISSLENNLSNFMGYTALSGFMLIGVLQLYNFATSKMSVDKRDYYGHYRIDRDMFPGKNAEWQYEKYRFRVDKSGSIIFDEKGGDSSIESCKVKFEVLEYFDNARIKLFNGRTCHHIFTSLPLLVRDSWSFQLVFRSPHYGNMYFKKVPKRKYDFDY